MVLASLFTLSWLMVSCNLIYITLSAGKCDSSEDASTVDLNGNLPFPITYYTLTAKQLEDNGYCFKNPGDAISPIRNFLASLLDGCPTLFRNHCLI